MLLTFSVLPTPIPGNIENTEKLQYSGEKLYKFTVTAYDCGKKRAADDAQVEIQVKPTCKPSWQGEEPRSVTHLLTVLEARLGVRGGVFGCRLVAVYPGWPFLWEPRLSVEWKSRIDGEEGLPYFSVSPLPSPSHPCRLEQKD